MNINFCVLTDESGTYILFNDGIIERFEVEESKPEDIIEVKASKNAS